jgi:hypothetical protein
MAGESAGTGTVSDMGKWRGYVPHDPEEAVPELRRTRSIRGPAGARVMDAVRVVSVALPQRGSVATLQRIRGYLDPVPHIQPPWAPCSDPPDHARGADVTSSLSFVWPYWSGDAAAGMPLRTRFISPCDQRHGAASGLREFRAGLPPAASRAGGSTEWPVTILGPLRPAAWPGTFTADRPRAALPSVGEPPPADTLLEIDS